MEMEPSPSLYVCVCVSVCVFVALSCLALPCSTLPTLLWSKPQKVFGDMKEAVAILCQSDFNIL